MIKDQSKINFPPVNLKARIQYAGPNRTTTVYHNYRPWFLWLTHTHTPRGGSTILSENEDGSRRFLSFLTYDIKPRPVYGLLFRLLKWVGYWLKNLFGQFLLQTLAAVAAGLLVIWIASHVF